MKSVGRFVGERLAARPEVDEAAPVGDGRLVPALERVEVGADGALAVNEVADPAAGAAVYVDAAGYVTRIVEKPAPGTSTTRWNNAGFGVLGPEVWPAIEGLGPSERGEYEVPRAIACAIESGARIRAVPIEGPWFDIGTPESLEAARAAFARPPR